MTEEEIEQIKIEIVKEQANSTKKALEFITKGKCFIEMKEESLKLDGDKKALDLFQDLCNGKKVKEALTYFGWKLDEDKKTKELTGSGVIALAIFKWLMADTNQTEENEKISKTIRESLLPNLQLTDTN